jgi:superoxide reductase
MAKKGKIYRCAICGNIVEVLEEGAGTLVCCGQDMNLLEEKEEDVGLEKHVPVIDIKENEVTVTVGDVLHPMEEKHYIQFIELLVDEDRYIKYLKPGDVPKAVFHINKEYTNISAREYCNIHGLWSS